MTRTGITATFNTTNYELCRIHDGEVLKIGYLYGGSKNEALSNRQPGAVSKFDLQPINGWDTMGGYHAWVPLTMLDTKNEFGEVSP